MDENNERTTGPTVRSHFLDGLVADGQAIQDITVNIADDESPTAWIKVVDDGSTDEPVEQIYGYQAPGGFSLRQLCDAVAHAYYIGLGPTAVDEECGSL